MADTASFAVIVSQDIFQIKMNQILEQVDSAVGIADDIMMCAKTDEKHDKILHKLMQVATIKAESISFF